MPVTALRWPIVLAVLFGALAGVGGYTFRYARGLSYFSKAPEACVNCHIMRGEYDAWQKSSHHTVAVCIDCHLPHAFIPKYLAKAENGWRHGKLFTTQTFAEPITVKAAGRRILQDNCVRCHAPLVDALLPATAKSAHSGTDGLACVHCHLTAGHGPPAGVGGPLRRAELSLSAPPHE
jgi:cytochrome c nitrite reductase small subunit